MTTIRAPRPARSLGRGRLPAAAMLLALALPAASVAPAAAQSPGPSPGHSAAPDAGGPGTTPGTCFLIQPTGSPTPPPTLAPGASPVPVAVREGTIPAAGGVLTPGQTYIDHSLGPTIGFTAGDCWAATPVDAGFGLALVWGGSPAVSVLSLSEFEGLVFEDPCRSGSDTTLLVDATPEGLIGDIAQSPYLIVSEPVDADLGGLPAVRVEVATQSPLDCTSGETWLWAAKAGGGFLLQDGEQATFLLTELNGRTLVASWETYLGGDFDAFSAAAEALLATLTIDPSTDHYDPNATPEPRPSVVPDASAAPEPVLSPSPAGQIG